MLRLTALPTLLAAVTLGAFALIALGAAPASADKCTGTKVKAIGKKESRLLSCSAKEAVKGTVGVEPDCDAKADGKFIHAYNTPGVCGDPPSTDCEVIADDCQDKVRMALPDGDGTTPSVCESKRLKAAGKKAARKLKCYAKAAAKDLPVDTAPGGCLDKASMKFMTAFTAASGCTGDGMETDIESLIDDECVNQLVTVDGMGHVTAICPAAATTTTTTGAATSTTTSTTTTTVQTTTTTAPPCPGTTLTLDASNSGFYRSDGVANTSGNYAVGWYGDSTTPPDVELRDYFVFDLSTVSGTITCAFLHLSTAPPGFVRYGSNDPSETYTLFDVSTPLPTLTGGTGGVAAFNDLGNGTSYGNLIATPAIGDTVDVNLNSAGIAFLAANSGQIAIGGAITTLAKGSSNEFLFNATNSSLTRQLVIITQ